MAINDVKMIGSTVSGTSMREVIGVSMPNIIDDDLNRNFFNRFKNFESETFGEANVGYMFITKPDFNLDQDFVNDPYLASLKRGVQAKANEIAGNGNTEGLNASSFLLDYFSGSKTGYPFISPLTNYVESINMVDNVLETEKSFQTNKGYVQVIPTSYIDSISEGSIDISYLENDDLDILRIHKIWVDYIDGVRFGTIAPNLKSIRKALNIGYLDYTSSIYFFLLGPDGRTIRYWSQFVGVFPTTIPYSALNWELGQSKRVNVSIPYSYSYKKDMDLDILKDFNTLSNLSGTITQTSMNIRDNWVKIPYITDDGKGHYFLEFGR